MEARDRGGESCASQTRKYKEAGEQDAELLGRKPRNGRDMRESFVLHCSREGIEAPKGENRKMGDRVPER